MSKKTISLRVSIDVARFLYSAINFYLSQHPKTPRGLVNKLAELQDELAFEVSTADMEAA